MRKLLIALIALLFFLPAIAQVNNMYNLMPVPSRLIISGEPYVITPDFRISITGNPDQRLYVQASRFMRRIGEKTGFFLDKQGYVTAADTSISSPLLIKVKRPGKLELHENENYSIEINSQQVEVTAETDLGAIHALETLMQLVSVNENGYYFPGVVIVDEPRFAWRGLMLDVVLHFMPMDVVKRTLDGMAAVKLNVLHLHLSNDQAFRVESKQFPQLQMISSNGLYFTQENIREIVRYAGQLGIRVVPEFVSPAHTTAILHAFPELASVKKNYALERYFGVFDPVMDPTNEKVYSFLDKLYSEMAALFPDRYFHIGGDENTGKDWEKTPHIKTFMTAHHMRSYMELQTYFNKRILPIVRKNHKIMMGWDEILQPGVPQDVVIQSWRGNDAFYQSIRNGYQAILSYGYYIDLIQPAAYHYSNDPLPDTVKLSGEEVKRILGGEATMWSEHVTPETVDSRIWPRTAAIAERLWSPQDVRDTRDMYRRLDVASLNLEALGLKHLSYKPAMLRKLANGYDARALEVLVNVIEPLKIYERNEGDTMYTVFSPYTKLADVATPDQPLPRIFNQQVDSFLKSSSSILAVTISKQLELWKDNDPLFLITLRHSPILNEAALLSKNLSAIATAGLAAMKFIQEHKRAGNDWLREQQILLKKAQQQGGRCELQVVIPIEKLIGAAGK